MTQGFRVFPTFYEAIRPLPDAERLLLWDAIMDYGFEGQEPVNLPPLLSGYFALIRPIIEKSVAYYAAQIANGAKGGRPKNCDKNPNESQAKPKANPNKERSGKMEEGIGNGREEKQLRSRFTPPTFEEIKTYCKERNSTVNAKRFYDYFEANDWKDSRGNPVKSWKQKLISWERLDAKPAPKTKDYTLSEEEGL